MARYTLYVSPATGVQLTCTVSPEIDELTPVTTGAVCTTFNVEAAVVAMMVPLVVTAAARTWCEPSVSPLVETLPLAVQLWPLTMADSWPTATHVPCWRACSSTDEKLDVACPEANTLTVAPAAAVGWALLSVNV